jgi:hypothetical protein
LKLSETQKGNKPKENQMSQKDMPEGAKAAIGAGTGAAAGAVTAAAVGNGGLVIAGTAVAVTATPIIAAGVIIGLASYGVGKVFKWW